MSCTRANVDVDETLVGRALGKWPTDVRHGFVAIIFELWRELEGEVFPSGSLYLNRLVVAASAFLQTEIHANWWLLQNDSERRFKFHEITLFNLLVRLIRLDRELDSLFCSCDAAPLKRATSVRQQCVIRCLVTMPLIQD